MESKHQMYLLIEMREAYNHRCLDVGNLLCGGFSSPSQDHSSTPSP